MILYGGTPPLTDAVAEPLQLALHAGLTADEIVTLKAWAPANIGKKLNANNGKIFLM